MNSLITSITSFFPLMNYEPNWLVASFISAVIGVALKPTIILITYLFRILKKGDLEGKWYGYYYIYKNNSNYIGKEILYINKGLYSEYSIKGISLTSTNQKYSGTAIIERNYFVIKMRPVIHKEEIFMRFKRHVPGNDSIMHGIWSAIDFDGNAAAGPMVISKQEQNDQDIAKIIKDKLFLVEENKNLLIK